MIDIKAADVNGDGAPDLLFGETLNVPWYVGTTIQVLINDGHGHFTDQTAVWMPKQPEVTSWPDRLLTEDVNDDGRPDLTIQYASAGRSATPVWLDTGTSLVPSMPPSDGDFSSSGLGPVGYINGDGPHALVSIDWADSNGGTPNLYVTRQVVVPAVPTHVRATTASGSVRISSPRVDGAASYDVWRAPQRGGTFVRLGSTAHTNFADRTAAHGREYRYEVDARNAAGTSRPSAQLPAATDKREPVWDDAACRCAGRARRRLGQRPPQSPRRGSAPALMGCQADGRDWLPEVDLVSTGAQPLPHRVHWPHRWVVWLVTGLVVAAGIAVGADRAFFAGQETRSEFMQGILDSVVSGPNRLAPGATAYVSGPHGTWVGSAGVADVKTGEPMRPDARMRIESNSKTWVEAVILQLLGEGKLSVDDTVDRWLPGLLRTHGSEITIRELMSDSSGLIDDNDVFASPSAARAYLARVGDPRLRGGCSRSPPGYERIRRHGSRRSGSFASPPGSRWSPCPAPPTTTPTSAGTSSA